MAAYGDPKTPSAYEYDHLVSLELGGAANDARNLWPDPGGSPNPKDNLENRLNSLICSGQLPLAEAQHDIATNWVFAYRKYVGSPPGAPASANTSSPRAAAPQPPAPSATCHVSVSNPTPRRGGSETVTVDTTPGAAVKTIAHYKSTDTEHDGNADGDGVATIAFSIGHPSVGYTVQIDVTTSSNQTCSTTFTPR